MRVAALILAAGLVLLLYLPFTGNGFLYDDYAVVLDPEPLGGPGDLGRLLLRPFYPGMTYYRPLAMASYQTQRMVVGESAGSYHVLNALLSAALLLAAYSLFRLPGLRIGRWPALFAATVFVAHPVSSSVVLPIAGRDTLLASLFVLLSVNAFCRPGRRSYASGLVFFGLALASKELAVMLPGLLLLVDACGISATKPARPGEWLRRYLPLGILVAGYLLLRAALLPEVAYPPGSPIDFALAYLYGLQVCLVPFTELVYEPRVAAWLSGWRLSIALLASGALTLAVWRLPARRLSLFWTGWFLVTLLPSANLIGQETRFAERYVFLPLLAIPALAATWISARRAQPLARRVAIVVGAVALVSLGWLVVLRGPSWEEEAFYRQWIRHDPERVTPHYNFGTVLEKRGKPDEAFEQYLVALKLDPEHDNAHNNLGKLLVARGEIDEALARFEHAVRLNPRNHQAHNNLGSALALEGNLDRGMQHFRRAIELRPDYKNARANLGHALVLTGDPEAAIEQFEVALDSDADYADAHYGLGTAYLALGRRQEAIAELRLALRLRPDLLQAQQLLERAESGVQ